MAQGILILKSISKSWWCSSFLIQFPHHLWSTSWAIFAWNTCPFLVHFPYQTHGISRIHSWPEHHLCCSRLRSMHIRSILFRVLSEVQAFLRCPPLESSNSLNLVCSSILWDTLFNLRAVHLFLRAILLGAFMLWLFIERTIPTHTSEQAAPARGLLDSEKVSSERNHKGRFSVSQWEVAYHLLSQSI